MKGARTERVESYQPPEPTESAWGAEHPSGVQFEQNSKSAGGSSKRHHQAASKGEKPIVNEVKEDIAEGNTTRNPLKSKAGSGKQQKSPKDEKGRPL